MGVTLIMCFTTKIIESTVNTESHELTIFPYAIRESGISSSNEIPEWFAEESILLKKDFKP